METNIEMRIKIYIALLIVTVCVQFGYVFYRFGFWPGLGSIAWMSLTVPISIWLTSELFREECEFNKEKDKNQS